MLNLIVSILVVVIAIYASYRLVRKTINTAIVVFPIPHKFVLVSEIVYSLAILILCCGLAFLFVRPGSMVNHSLASFEERVTSTNWKAIAGYPAGYISDQYTKRQQQLRDLEVGSRVTHLGQNLATQLGAFWSSIAQFGGDIFQGIGKFIARTVQSLAQDDSPLTVTPRSNFKGTLPGNFVCVANPGQEYNFVFLRENPSWSGLTDSQFVAARGTEIKLSGKVENEDGIWFVTDSQDGSRRYVNAAICSTTSDLDLIPIVSPGD